MVDLPAASVIGRQVHTPERSHGAAAILSSLGFQIPRCGWRILAHDSFASSVNCFIPLAWIA